MTPELLAEIAGEANLAPSVHNTQPVLWRSDGSDGLILSLDPERRLLVGDPEGQDARLSGGAAFLGTRYALWRRGLEARAAEIEGDEVRLALSDAPEGRPPPLDLLARRTSYRAGFGEADGPQKSRLAETVGHHADIKLFSNPTQVAQLADLNDTASLAVMRDAAFRAELLSWMRLGPAHRDWHRDGLSAEALAMGRAEAIGAGVVLRRPVFELLGTLGLARSIVAEAARTKTATALLAFHRPADENRWISGGAFYELWLRLTEAGFAAWPMAVLADDPEARAEVCRLGRIADDRALITVLRVGPHPIAKQPAKARLPRAELIREA